MFPNMKIIEFYGDWEDDRVDERTKKFGEDITIIETPGHASTGLSLVVDTDKGKVVICGDVFWKENFPESDPYADEPEKVGESRRKVLEIADFVIPRHAGEYEVKK